MSWELLWLLFCLSFVVLPLFFLLFNGLVNLINFFSDLLLLIRFNAFLVLKLFFFELCFHKKTIIVLQMFLLYFQLSFYTSNSLIFWLKTIVLLVTFHIVDFCLNLTILLFKFLNPGCRSAKAFLILIKFTR